MVSVNMTEQQDNQPQLTMLAEIEVMTLYSGWDRREAAAHLALALQGKVLQLLAKQLCEQDQDMEKLTGIAAEIWSMEPKELARAQSMKCGEKLGKPGVHLQWACRTVHTEPA